MREVAREQPTDERPDHEAPGALTVVGAGKLGSSLAQAAEAAGIATRIAGRGDALEACRSSEAALLCVPDAEITAAAATVAEAVPPLGFVGHTSGATRLAALASCRAAGASIFSIHPLQTVPGPETEITAAPCALAASDPAGLEFARKLAERLGMRPFALDEEARAAYHAAASIASNFLVSLEESAAGLLAKVGVGDARELLAPLVLRSAANWAEHGADALTGPIARGDEATVTAHLEALRERAPELVPLYEALADRTRALARDAGMEPR